MEKQIIKEVVDCLKERFWRTRLEQIKVLVLEYIKFKDDDYENEYDLLQAMIEFQRRKEELSVNEKEWHSVWILKKFQKRK